ncbi:hypothetical protein GCM10027093_21360 [Paraburkholderia jirisanensis]
MAKSLAELACDAGTLHALIQTLMVAVPCDTIDCDVPVKSTLLHLERLARILSEDISEIPDHV